jgi:hypothetical protein
MPPAPPPPPPHRASVIAKVGIPVAAVLVALVLWLTFYGPGPTKTVQSSIPANVPAQTVQQVDTNTSQNCPGKISDLETIDETGKTFNPKGCYYYYWGTGTAIFEGMGGLKTPPTDLASTTPHVPRMIYKIRAVPGTTGQFQYFLCDGPKWNPDPKKLSCV